MYINLPKVSKATVVLLVMSIFWILFFLFPISSTAQYLPDNFGDIKPLGNKLMVKIKANSITKLEQVSTSFNTKKVERRFHISQVNAPLPSLKKAKAATIRLQDWYEVEISSSTTVQEAIHYYQSQDFVEYAEPIYPNYILAPPYIPNDPFTGGQWQLGKSELYAAWGLHKGDTNTVIGIVDTGVRLTHADLKNQIKVNYAERYGTIGVDDDNNGFVDDSLGYSFGLGMAASNDFNGHGTGVAGMAAATTDNVGGIAGTSFNCRILPVGVLSLSFQIINMYDGIIYAADNGCKVINVSIGRPNLGFQWEQDVIDYVTLVKDVLVVAAAGNTNLELDFYPASYKHVLSVAHSDASDNKWTDATYSNYVDVMAPGARVYTTHVNGNYSNAWGSSYASPFVAGIAALVRSAFPHLSADQAGELVRITSDDRYNLPSNISFFEKLGKGRVNAFRALSEESSAKAIRMDNFSYFGKNGQVAFSGDTITLEADFINYLNPITQNGRIVISTSSAHIRVLDSVFDISAMTTMQQKNNARQPFRFVVNQNAPLDLDIKFRLGFSDTNYSDYQYFEIPINAPYLAIPFNTINFTLTGNGRAGYYDIYNRLGSGIKSNNSQTLQEGGLIVGKSVSKVSDNILTKIGGIEKDDDFKMIDIPRIIEKTPFFTKATSKFADTLGAIVPPVGVHIKHTVKGRTNTPHHQYIILEYEFTNISGSAMDSMNVGLYYDWNLGDYTRNFADWDNTREFGYVFGAGTSGYAGIKAISSNKTYFALDFQNVGGDNINVNDGFTSAEKYQSVSTGISRKRAGFSAAGGDVAHIVGTVLHNLGINETRKVTFVVMIAPTLAALRDAHDAAVLATNPTSSISPTPIFNNTLCENTSYTITPQGGTNFRLYDIANTQTPLQTGTSFTLTPADLGRVFYVTNTDSVLEGDYTTLRFNARTAIADFTAPAQLNLDQNTSISFIDASQNALSWLWDFGNGQTSILQNPSTSYSRQGSYTVSLTITDIAGCSSTKSKVIQVVRKSPKPIISAVARQSCDNTPTEIRPLNGTNFRFYNSQNRFLAIGRSYVVPAKSLDSLYVTNVDSALESDKVLVKIQWVILNATFSASPRYDTLLYDNVLFQNTSVSDFFIQNTTWDFGDGSPTRTGATARHTYSAQGRYKVKMTTKNDFGCSKIVERWFYVGKVSPQPTITSPIQICKGSTITIRPTGGTVFNFYSKLDSLPILHGCEISFNSNSYIPSILYIKGADSLIESEPVSTRLEVIQVTPNFDFSRELYLDEQATLRFTDNTSDAISWLWNFGDGTTSTQRNPTHAYNTQGDYIIKLTVRTATGCQGTASKSLLVFRRSPKPIVHNLFVCRYDSTTIIPQGGTLFNFYNSATTDQPIHTGRVYNLGFISEPKDIWVTNLDSALESAAVKVHVDFSRPSSDFEMSAINDTLNIFKKDTLFLNDKSNSAVWWYWNFGNGQIATTQTTQTIYKQQGEYQITLITRDTLGCIDSLNRKLIVIDKPVITGGDSNTNYQILVYPNPASDYLNAYIELQTSEEVMIRIYNSLGQELITSKKEQITKKRFVFDVRKLTKGVYYVQIIMSDKVVNKKIVLE